MANRSVQLYLYADLPGIGWRYCRAVFGAKNNLSLYGLGASHGLTTASPTTEKSLTLRDTRVREHWRAVAASRASMTERGRPFILAWARTKPHRFAID
jgi:hypothetical protein